MRHPLLLIAVLMMGCESDVILGVNRQALDGGTLDGGTLDGGTLDGGTLDGGTLDGGALDGGPADLQLELSGPLVIQQGDTATFIVRAINSGGSPALMVTATVTAPASASFVSSGSCVGLSGNQTQCNLGSVAGGTFIDAPFQLQIASAVGWHQLTGSVSSSGSEPDAGNNVAQRSIAVTGVGVQAVPIVAPRFLDISACFGTNITSYAMCTPGSLVSERVELLIDGGVDSLDAGYSGLWGQSTHLRNLAFRFFGPGGVEGSAFTGASVSALCFEGAIDPMTLSGAWRGCLN